MSTSNRLQKEVAKDLYVTLLVTGNNHYAYFSVRADKIEEFHGLVGTKGDFKLPPYAVLHEEGPGIPSAEDKRRIEATYGFSHNLLQDLSTLTAA